MKKTAYLMTLWLLLLLTAGSVRATVVNESDHFFCGFDTQEEYDQWTMLDLNGTDGAGNNTCWWDGDWKAAMFSVGTNFSANEWLISPSFTLTGGKKYVVKVNFRSDGSWEKLLTFTMGTEATVESQTVVLRGQEMYYPGDYYLLLEVPTTVGGGNYHFAIHSETESWCGATYIKSVEVVEAHDGKATICFVDAADESNKLEGVQATLQGATLEPVTQMSDADGAVSFENLTPGVYNVCGIRDGYYPLEAHEVIVEANAEILLNITMEQGLTSTVTGRVKDESGSGVAHARVALSGEKFYETTTAYDGYFTIEQVRRPQNYQLCISKDYKYSHKAEVALLVENADVDLGEIVLKDLVVAPVHVDAEVTQSLTLVSWLMPVAEKEFMHGTGNVRGGEFTFNSTYPIVGSVFHEPMSVSSVSWVIANAPATVDVYVYLVNKDGSLSTTPAFSQKDVPTLNYDYTPDDYEWSEYTLPEPIGAPYGCIVAIGHEGSITVRSDYTGQGGSVCRDVNTDGWGFPDQSCFLIKANGHTLATDFDAQAPQMSSPIRRCVATKSAGKKSVADGFSYTLYRYPAKDKDKPEAWTKLGEGIQNFFYLDREYVKLPQGAYQYAVQTVFDDGNASAYGYSPVLENRLYTELTVHVYTNTAVDYATGTKVTLTEPGNPEAVTVVEVADNRAVFSNIRKGSYALAVEKAGFAPQYFERIDVDSKEKYEMEVDLELIPAAPYQLQAEQLAGTHDVVVTWNNNQVLTEGFEEMEDFAVNPRGTLGWEYLDADGLNTYGIKQCETTPYPNMCAPMAFMAFNPGATTPDVTEYYQPYEGQKMLVSVAVADGVSANNDYLFSPDLSFDADFTLSFQAASGLYAMLGNERFMVGYTEGETTAEAVKWLTEEPVSVGGAWTPFSYHMPKEAKRAVIRCVSNQCMFFMLDNVRIGCEEPDIFNMALFNVEVDGEMVATTHERRVTLDALEAGKHLVKVQTVYRMFEGAKQYSDFAELVVQVSDEVAGVSELEVQTGYTYDANAACIIAGEGVDSLKLYDLQGRLCGESDRILSTRALQSGTYVLSLKGKFVSQQTKIVVK